MKRKCKLNKVDLDIVPKLKDLKSIKRYRWLYFETIIQIVCKKNFVATVNADDIFKFIISHKTLIFHHNGSDLWAWKGT